MKPLDYETICTCVRAFLLDIAKKGGQTPNNLEISKACDFPPRAATEILKRLEAAGRLRIVRRGNYSIQLFRLADGKEIVSTAFRTPKAPPMVNAFGGGRIAAMRDRDKAEKLIAAVFRGELSEADAQEKARP